MLSRGSIKDKLEWAFTLYDIDGDGVVTKDEFTQLVTSIYDMMGKCTEPAVDDRYVSDHISRIYEVGVITRSVSVFHHRCSLHVSVT